jgi:hypothetical protein
MELTRKEEEKVASAVIIYNSLRHTKMSDSNFYHAIRSILSSLEVPGDIESSDRMYRAFQSRKRKIL